MAGSGFLDLENLPHLAQGDAFMTSTRLRLDNTEIDVLSNLYGIQQCAFMSKYTETTYVPLQRMRTFFTVNAD